MSTSTNQESLQIAVSAMTQALRGIAGGRDCDYDAAEEDRPTPCPCPRCVATNALAIAGGWRFVGAFHARVTTHSDHNPRELKLHRAWSRRADDRLLAQILTPDGRGARDGRPLETPSARDWYVATSVVQWLATNVGRCVLEEAGFRYQGDREDQADREIREVARDGRPRPTPLRRPASRPGEPADSSQREVADAVRTRGLVAEGRIERAIEDAASIITGAISGDRILPGLVREVARRLGERVVRASVARLEGR